MPEIWARIQLSASLMKITVKAVLDNIPNNACPQSWPGRWPQKNIGRDEDEHFDSLTLLVPKLGTERGTAKIREKRAVLP